MAVNTQPGSNPVPITWIDKEVLTNTFSEINENVNFIQVIVVNDVDLVTFEEAKFFIPF